MYYIKCRGIHYRVKIKTTPRRYIFSKLSRQQRDQDVQPQIQVYCTCSQKAKNHKKMNPNPNLNLKSSTEDETFKTNTISLLHAICIIMHY